MTRQRPSDYPDTPGPGNGVPRETQTPTLPHGATTAAVVPLLPLLLSLAQAAVLLGVSTKTTKRLIAGGELPEGAVTRIGRRRLLNRLVLEEWVRRGCPPPAAGRRRKPR
jgi:excisionase family DNA binding protein